MWDRISKFLSNCFYCYRGPQENTTDSLSSGSGAGIPLDGGSISSGFVEGMHPDVGSLGSGSGLGGTKDLEVLGQIRGGQISACCLEQTQTPFWEIIVVTFVLVVLIVLVLFVVASKDKENSKLRKWLD